MRRGSTRNQSGISLVELTAAMVFGLPPIMLMLYATLEANLLFTIRTNLDVATRRAAQLLIDDYLNNGYKSDGSGSNLPPALQFNVPTADGKHYFINNNATSGGANQFTWTFDLTNKPNTVTVTVTYPTNKNNGLLPFPSPDPLGVGSSFTILTSGTFAVPNL
ncbi:MAG TPA: TadE family protein [Candidatus Obscuribacterales bacterium]